jgi:cytosine/adenosine deaminase-related metal-dependent hydrolase
MSCEPPEAPKFTQEQKEEFSKLALDFLVRNGFQKSIPAIEIEIRFKPRVTEGSEEQFAASMMDCGCRDTDNPDPEDWCYPQVWRPG